MLKIPEVTLVILADLDIEDAVYAINKSCEAIHWGAAKFLSSKGRPRGLNPNVDYEEVYPIQSINDFNFYCIYNLTNHVRTSHCLLIHPDGYVIRPHLWDPKFLDYEGGGSPRKGEIIRCTSSPPRNPPRKAHRTSHALQWGHSAGS